MPISSGAGMAILGGTSLLGGFLGGQSAQRAAETSANAQLRAAQIAADAAKFRPVGITTRYGTSNFQFDPSGYVSGAGYEVSPELKAYQDRLQALTGGALTQAEMAQQQYAPLQQSATGLFGLGQQYLQQTPQQVAAQYMQQQQDLLAPSRERSMAQLQNQLYQQGRGGLSVGATGMRPSGAAGFGAASPEMEAYYNAMAQQDAQLAANAQSEGQRNVAFGAGLLGSGSQLMSQYQSGQVGALNPFTTYLGGGQAIEQMGQQPLEMGSALGGRSATAGANVGQSLLTGGISAARAQQAGAYDPFATALSGLANNQQFSQGVVNAYDKYFGGGGGMNEQEAQNMANVWGASYKANQPNPFFGYYGKP
jgi:hypothetical protein